CTTFQRDDYYEDW
nr:immunoglobulin heavy chain junction region [Macaca mulatta]MOY19768.1 immunoglobulin heavy chain junction region [Macaca mulatta]